MASQQSNVIEILVQAKDQASKQIGDIAASFNAVDVATKTATLSFQKILSTNFLINGNLSEILTRCSILIFGSSNK